MILHLYVLYVFMVMWVPFCPNRLFYLFLCVAGFDGSQRSWARGGGSQWELGTAHTHTGTQHPTVISAMYATPHCHICQVRNTPLSYPSGTQHPTVISFMYATPHCHILHVRNTPLSYLPDTQHPTVISFMYATPHCHILQVRNTPLSYLSGTQHFNRVLGLWSHFVQNWSLQQFTHYMYIWLE